MPASCWEALQEGGPWASSSRAFSLGLCTDTVAGSLTGLLGRAHGVACCYSTLQRGAGSQFWLVSTLFDLLSPGRDEVLLRDRSLQHTVGAQ